MNPPDEKEKEYVSKLNRIDLKPDVPPSLQLKEQKKFHSKTTTYLPHMGSKQKAKAAKRVAQAVVLDPRDPDPSKEGVFRDHNCWRCKNGTLPCPKGNPRNCENLHARND